VEFSKERYDNNENTILRRGKYRIKKKIMSKIIFIIIVCENIKKNKYY
jgi:hypothetical protein